MAYADPKVTELLLISQDGVQSACVWYENSRLVAEVTVREDADLTQRQLIALCREELGPRYTPSQLIFLKCRQKAA
jgi:hypothetical protein